MFSVVIPLYNKRDYIARAINSVLAQTFKDFEIIVVDDGSTDGSGDLVSELYRKEVKFFRQENFGVSSARNQGIRQAAFSWIAFLDADDYWHPQYLAFMARVISENPHIGIIGAHYDSVRLSEKPQLDYLPFSHYFKQAVRNTYFFTSATVVKKEFFENKPGFDPKLKLGEDIDVWLRASLYFGDGLYVRNTLVLYGSEDAQRATKRRYLLNETLVSKILEKNYYSDSLNQSSCTESEFEAFRDRRVYFTLFQHFRILANRIEIGEVLRTMKPKYFLVRSIYMLPFGVLHRLFQYRAVSKLFRNYIKFCFRYIYR